MTRRDMEVASCRINVYLILIQGNKILMMRRKNTGFQDGMYGVPSGKLDQGETIAEALLREAKEEVGIMCVLNDAWHRNAYILHRYSGEGTVAMEFFIRLHSYTGVVQNREEEKCDDVAWFPVDDLPENTIPYVKKGILNALSGVILDEYIWE